MNLIRQNPRKCKSALFTGETGPTEYRGVMTLDTTLRCPAIGEATVSSDHIIADLRMESYVSDIVRISESMGSTACVGCQYFNQPVGQNLLTTSL